MQAKTTSTVNLHDAVTRLNGRAPDLLSTGYPELHQIHVPAEGKTYFVVLEADCRGMDNEWDDSQWICSDVSVLDAQTGKFSVIPQEQVTPEQVRAWMREPDPTDQVAPGGLDPKPAE